MLTALLEQLKLPGWSYKVKGSHMVKSAHYSRCFGAICSDYASHYFLVSSRNGRGHPYAGWWPQICIYLTRPYFLSCVVNLALVLYVTEYSGVNLPLELLVLHKNLDLLCTFIHYLEKILDEVEGRMQYVQYASSNMALERYKVYTCRDLLRIVIQ